MLAQAWLLWLSLLRNCHAVEPEDANEMCLSRVSRSGLKVKVASKGLGCLGCPR